MSYLNRNGIRGLSLIVLMAAALLVLNACIHEAANDDPFADVEPTYTSLWDAYFNSCATNCHESTNATGLEDGPNMSTKTAFYNGLRNKSSSDYPTWLRTGDCDGYAYIAPGDAAGSLLPAAIIESSSSSFSSSHGGCTTAYNVHVVNNIHVISENLKTQIIAWINDGAANN